ncbi:MAG: Uma2 family endonuclease [Anaerolineae bacterium]|nr:Uma2 family endonuclease [Anaerolineae bacterium]
MMIAPTRIGMAMEDFIRAFDEAPFELIDGERIARTLPVAEHGEITKALYRLLLSYEEHYKSILVLSELPFILEDTPDWVKGSRVPDIMVFEASRIATYRAEMPDYAHKPLVVVPDLCIEIISQNDSYIDVEDKVNRYLEDGVQMVWVVNPRQQSVTQHHTDGHIERLTGDDELKGGDLMPEFAIKVKALFEA